MREGGREEEKRKQGVGHAHRGRGLGTRVGQRLGGRVSVSRHLQECPLN